MPTFSLAGFFDTDDDRLVVAVLHAWLGTDQFHFKVRLSGWELTYESPALSLYVYPTFQGGESLLEGRLTATRDEAESQLRVLVRRFQERSVEAVFDYVEIDGDHNEIGPEVRVDASTLSNRLKPVYEIDGSRIHNLGDFWDEVSRSLIPGADWGRNLNAFNDILRGGFGTPVDGFVLRWLNSEASRTALGYPETVRDLERALMTCHPESRAVVQEELAKARRGEGQTLFEAIVDIIRIHGAGGDEAVDGVELELL